MIKNYIILFNHYEVFKICYVILMPINTLTWWVYTILINKNNNERVTQKTFFFFFWYFACGNSAYTMCGSTVYTTHCRLIFVMANIRSFRFNGFNIYVRGKKWKDAEVPFISVQKLHGIPVILRGQIRMYIVKRGRHLERNLNLIFILRVPKYRD